MKILTTISIAALAFAVAGTSHAASHREAPFIAEMPKVDATDFYAFRSYEANRAGYVTLIANYNPLQDPYGGPNYFSMSRDALYEIHVDNTGDAVEDLTFQFQFDDKLGNNGAGITLDINGKDIAVPLKNVGVVTSADSASLNYHESYSVTMVKGDRRSGTKQVATGTGGAIFGKPYDNVGQKTFSGTGGYDSYANSFIHDVTLTGCPTGSQDGKVFVGQRKDSFKVNLGKVFDLVNLSPATATGVNGFDSETDDLADKNITTIALEVPIACLTGGNTNGIIGAWTTASLPQVRVLDPTPKALSAQVNSGAWTQVSRLGAPLVNEVVIGLPDKNLFNASEPKNDPQFLDYVTNPTLPALLNALFGVVAPTNTGRGDLVAAFLTGIDGVNKDGSVGEVLRLNTGIAATAKGSQNNLGVAGNAAAGGTDNAGFPNGRRPGDDVVDIALRASMGLLCHLPLNLCVAADAPNGLTAFTDSVEQNDSQFGDTFPYLTTPIGGS
jgi:hypothetical protein